MLAAAFQPFDIRVPLVQICTKLEDVTRKRRPLPLPEPTQDLLGQLKASLHARGVSEDAIEAHLGATGAAAPPHARVGRVIPTEAAFLDLCRRLEAALDALPGRPAAAIGGEAAIARDSNLGAVLSPSQVGTFRDCSARWYFKYFVGLPDPPTGNQAFGRAIHAALAENFRQKAETRADLPVAGVIALFRDAWARELEATVLRRDESADDFRGAGEVLVAKYMDESAPLIQPAVIEVNGQRQAAVELAVEGAIGGVPARGRVDLIEEDGTILDVKTSQRRPPSSNDHALQLAVYADLAPKANGKARIDTLVKTKTVQLVRQTYTVSDEDRRAAATLFPLVQEGMRGGLYFPNRRSMLCSRRNCSFWRACQSEFGGTVDET